MPPKPLSPSTVPSFASVGWGRLLRLSGSFLCRQRNRDLLGDVALPALGSLKAMRTGEDTDQRCATGAAASVSGQAKVPKSSRAT